MVERYTLGSPVVWEGIGVHLGEQGLIQVSPGSDGLQVAVQGELYPLWSARGIEVSRCTGIEVAGSRFLTVEHLLSALNGLGVTDAVIEINGPEVPILDGSSLPFAEAIRASGLVCLGVSESQEFEAFEVQRGDSRISVRPGAGNLDVSVAYEHPHIGQQRLALRLTPETYVSDVAPARTFGLLEEAEKLRSMGLAKGASLENTLVFSSDGALSPLRFPDEPVRHKLLDLIGDLALSAIGIFEMDVVAVRPGHAANAEAAMRLRERVRERRNRLDGRVPHGYRADT